MSQASHPVGSHVSGVPPADEDTAAAATAAPAGEQEASSAPSGTQRDVNEQDALLLLSAAADNAVQEHEFITDDLRWAPQTTAALLHTAKLAVHCTHSAAAVRTQYSVLRRQRQRSVCVLAIGNVMCRPSTTLLQG